MFRLKKEKREGRKREDNFFNGKIGKNRKKILNLILFDKIGMKMNGKIFYFILLG